jgi:DNA polymerase
MADNTQNPLTAYFQYQRDIGVSDIIFGQGSEVGKILSAAAKSAGTGFSGPRGSSAPALASTRLPPPKMSSDGASLPPVPANEKTDPGGADSFSKLSKIRPVDTINTVKFERKPISPAFSVTQSAKREKLAGLYHEVVKCDRCEAAHNRNKVVFGSGSADGKLFVVGYSPDFADDAAGLPFQGADGELFDKILGKMGLDRKEGLFAAYIQKCRGGGFDRGHAGVCREILDRQIDIVAPKALLVFGQPAANFLLENDDDIEQLRGINHTYRGVPAVVTYSLSLMSKETQYRFGAWDDMKKIMDMV